MCLRVLKESNKVDSTGTVVRNSVLIISHITFWGCRMHIFPTTFLEIAVYYHEFQSEEDLCTTVYTASNSHLPVFVNISL